MPVYKVWNSERTSKKFVVASSLENLIECGAKKFNIDMVNCSLVLEEDGTHVDEDEILNELNDKTFILLKPTEIWSESKSTHPIINPSNQSENVETDNILTPSVIEDGQSTMGVYGDISDVPLPRFSPLVLRHIESVEGTVPERIWSLMISEAAQHYIAKFPSIGESHEYKDIGKKMYHAYPVIGLDGHNPWSTFNKSLSQKIRHMRLIHKTRSLEYEPTKKKRCFDITPLKATTTGCNLTAEDIERHSEELKKEWSKASPNETHLTKLFKTTRLDRMDMLKNGKSSSEITDKYPCLSSGKFVLNELSLMIGHEKFRRASHNMKTVMFAVEEIADISIDHNDPLRMISTVMEIEKRTEWHQGAKTKSKSVMTIKEDLSDTEIPKVLTTLKEEAPRIVVLKYDSKLSGIYVVLDTIKIEIPICGGVLAAVMALISCYYIFDLEYPKSFSMLLGFLQTYVMEEPYKNNSSKRFKVFNKLFRQVFDKFPKYEEIEN